MNHIAGCKSRPTEVSATSPEKSPLIKEGTEVERFTPPYPTMTIDHGDCMAEDELKPITANTSLQQAQEWSTTVDPKKFYSPKYPIEFLCPSATLELAPEFAEYFNDPGYIDI